MKIYPIRTRFAKEIVAEVLFPEKQTGKVVILLGGMPALPGKPDVMKFFATQGFVAIVPRFRGTWESGGEFLKNEPVSDIFDIVNEITAKNYKGVYDSFTDTYTRLRSTKIFVVGGSFGGTGAVLASAHPKVRKVVALSPVIDWSYDSIDEPFSFFETFVPYAFGEAYRYKKGALRRLYKNEIYSPLKDTEKCIGKKILIIHTQDDGVVSIDPVYSFVRDTNAQLVELRRGGHLGLSDTRRARFSKVILPFLQ
jgi:dipeptidyl aminopeptidase/acylaminoacyl peptidase